MINYLQSISLSTKSFPSFNICRGEEITSSLLNIYFLAEDMITVTLSARYDILISYIQGLFFLS